MEANLKPLTKEDYVNSFFHKWFKGVEDDDNPYWIIEAIGYLTCLKDVSSSSIAMPNVSKECNERIDILAQKLDTIIRERKQKYVERIEH